MNLKQTSIKAIAVVISVFCSLIGIAHAQSGFYLWADENATICEVYAVPYVSFNIYVFLEPPAEGAISAEYRLVVPKDHFSVGITPCIAVSDSTSGIWDGSPGIHVEFTSCQTDMFWIVCYTMMSSNTVRAGYWLYPHIDTQFMGAENCLEPSERVNMTPFNCLTFHDTAFNCMDYYIDPTGVAETTWGAIKAMLRE